MALSRLYLGVHYPSDSLAGAALGGAIARLTP
jgi:membrane-associated phospholipid phosphatase